MPTHAEKVCAFVLLVKSDTCEAVTVFYTNADGILPDGADFAEWYYAAPYANN